MQNFLDPAILFFVFGVIAGALRSNLEIPAPIAKFLSLYLLMALGLKGGFALAASGLTLEILLSLLAAMLMAFLVPLLGYALLRHKVSGFDAAALAASYGSVSAVTFLTASGILDALDIGYGGHMVAVMALMESPAIVVGILLLRRSEKASGAAEGRNGPGWGALL
ncbi:MAG: sodium-dependent bicarbonate transport family permease, partial [Betaproteobacteria bacterium]